MKGRRTGDTNDRSIARLHIAWIFLPLAAKSAIDVNLWDQGRANLVKRLEVACVWRSDGKYGTVDRRDEG